jgi:hypothetical protein
MKSGRGNLSDAHDDIHTKGLAGMNRNGRSKLSMAVRRLRQDSVSSHDAFIKVISRLMDDESGKLGNIPESLAGSPVSSGIEDSIDMMDEASELSEGIIEAADEIAQLCGVDASPGMLSAPGIACSCFESAGIDADQPRSSRLQLLVQPSLIKHLKDVSKARGCSVNQLVNDMLLSCCAGKSGKDG